MTQQNVRLGREKRVCYLHRATMLLCQTWTVSKMAAPLNLNNSRINNRSTAYSGLDIINNSPKEERCLLRCYAVWLL
jgi:hypothetical protein